METSNTEWNLMENMEYDNINLEYLYEVSDGEIEFVKEIINDYLTKVPPQFTELQDALQAGDLENIKFIAHKMKSSFQFMGAQVLVDLAHQIEITDERDRKDVAERSVNTMNPIIEKVLAELKHKLSTL